MKNCDEMVNSLLERRDKYNIEKKRRKRVITRAVVPMCCVCLVALLGVGMWQGGMFGAEEVKTLDDSVIPGGKDYIGPGETDFAHGDDPISQSGDVTGEETDDICDILGMVVIEGETYVQFHPDESYTPDVYLGFASDFEGTYKTYLYDVAGKLYTTKESKDVLLVILENDATVALIKTEE